MNEMTFVKKIKKNRYTDEIDALHVMQDAISSSSEDELRHLRENKGDVQRVPAAIQSAQFKTCPPNHTQNRNQNYENFIEKIAETRSRAQLKTNLLKDEIIQLNNSYNQFVKRISRRTKDNAAELQTMKNTLEAIQNSRERNIEDYEKLKFKISALETQSASESKELNRRVKSLSVELEKLRKLETLQSLEELENPENSSN